MQDGNYNWPIIQVKDEKEIMRMESKASERAELLDYETINFIEKKWQNLWNHDVTTK
jgi:hypothetical protein